MSSKKGVSFAIIVYLLLGIFNQHALAAADENKITGRCDNPYLSASFFPVGPDGKVDRAQAVKVIQQDTPVYQDVASSAVLTTLGFNKSLRVLDVQGHRVQVGHESTLAPLGWVEQSALLCGFLPLKGKSGLEQKLYIQTATEIRQEKPATVKAYPSPELNGCEAVQCRELSRFTGYFVFDIDEQHNSYLLSENYKLDDTSQLVGWVDGKNGFVWDTAYGLRPQEHLVLPEGQPMAGQERPICAYQTLDDAISNPDGKCLPILGGDRWFLSEHRIPILERMEQNGRAFYKVVLPLAGTGAKIEKDGGKITIINPEQFTQDTSGIDSLSRMKHVDVLFLIDGTKSMINHLHAIKGSQEKQIEGVVQKIMRTLQDDDAFREAQFRFGFRIYRDTFAKDRELGEGLPMSPNSCELTPNLKDENIKQFSTAIDQITVTEEASDDYPENLFGGIRQAILDLAPCPNNTKLLFVIGDCGYDMDAQRQHGSDPVELASLVKSLQGSDQFKTIVPFFIQTPKDTALQRSEYERAYTLFTDQARQIVTPILGVPRSSEFPNYLMTTDAADLNNKILAGVKQFSNTQVINELVLDLRGGADLISAITRLQGSKEYNNIPGLFWDLVEQGSCKQLGDQCHTRLYDTIIQAYIPISTDIIEDVWLKSEDLDKWISILRNFDSEKLSGISGSELRQAFVSAIKDGLEKVIRKPMYADTGEPLREYLKRKGSLPVSDTSPLFGYSIDDLSDPESVGNCELDRLSSWVNNANKMLNIVYHGDLRPSYTEEPFPGECPMGNNVIPFISGDIVSAPLGKNQDMRYDHSFQKAHVYWVPKKFLP